MAEEIRKFDFTIPVGTLEIIPLTQKLNMPSRKVARIKVRVPPGPAGEMGFRIGASGTQIIPYNDETWLIADNETFDFPLDNTVESGGWEVTGYNAGDYDHTIYITFYLNPVTTEEENNQPLNLEGEYE